MEPDFYFDLKSKLIEFGYADEIDWQTNIQPCESYDVFEGETIWVILNSGMKEQIARLIWNRIKSAWKLGLDTSTAFNHKGKVAAIDFVKENAERIFLEYKESENPIEYLQTIPFIGNITKWHLAKNLGFDCMKPDRHLVRIAKDYGYSDPKMFVYRLSGGTGDKVSVVDIVLWRSANLGLI